MMPTPIAVLSTAMTMIQVVESGGVDDEEVLCRFTGVVVVVVAVVVVVVVGKRGRASSVDRDRSGASGAGGGGGGGSETKRRGYIYRAERGRSS